MGIHPKQPSESGNAAYPSDFGVPYFRKPTGGWKTKTKNVDLTGKDDIVVLDINRPLNQCWECMKPLEKYVMIHGWT